MLAGVVVSVKISARRQSLAVRSLVMPSSGVSESELSLECLARLGLADPLAAAQRDG